MSFSLNLQGCKYISLNIQKINLTYIIGHTLLYKKLLGIIKLYYDEINN
jgi:hypothetical protein